MSKEILLKYTRDSNPKIGISFTYVSCNYELDNLYNITY